MDIDEEVNVKSVVSRGARACTVCRQSKMKCIGAIDGERPCHRCEKQNVECIFEKHRRGRKPGSKLSEASKMLRLLEKGLSSAKLKSQDNCTEPAKHAQNLPDGSLFPSERLLTAARSAEAIMANGDDQYDTDAMIPSRLISREQKRTSFFRTILNDPGPSQKLHANGFGTSSINTSLDEEQKTLHSTMHRTLAPPLGFQDPVSAGLITESDCNTLFDLIFLRLNPFINLFDPALHTANYVRHRCPLLFCTLLAAGCKFWKPGVYCEMKQMAKQMAIRAFAENWKSTEVCQAFACLTYWKEPEESTTWTYIGYACRMAVELNLGHCQTQPCLSESETQRRERRNRERTFLVLWIHDRSLSMQTGRRWMLPENPLVANSHTWHLEEPCARRPEDVIVSAFVQLRRIGAETADVFMENMDNGYCDVNYEVILHGCNAKLTRWMDHWTAEMKQVGGQLFQLSMLKLFRLHVRLFLNTYGLQTMDNSRNDSNLHALSACYESGIQSLQIVSQDLLRLNMLPYGQDSIIVMTAYSAVCLLYLLRKISILDGWREEDHHQKVYSSIEETANALHDAIVPGQNLRSAEHHARFLRNLLDKHGWSPPPTDKSKEAFLFASQSYPPSPNNSNRQHHNVSERSRITQLYDSVPGTAFISAPESLSMTHAPIGDARDEHHQHNVAPYSEDNPDVSVDQVYWRNMHIELGLNSMLELADANMTWDSRNQPPSAHLLQAKLEGWSSFTRSN